MYILSLVVLKDGDNFNSNILLATEKRHRFRESPVEADVGLRVLSLPNNSLDNLGLGVLEVTFPRGWRSLP